MVEDHVPWYVIHPNSIMRLLWDLIMTFLIFYIAFVDPFRIAFEVRRAGRCFFPGPPTCFAAL